MENEIFGNFEKSESGDADTKLNENESNSAVVEELKKESSKSFLSSFSKYFFTLILIMILTYYWPLFAVQSA